MEQVFICNCSLNQTIPGFLKNTIDHQQPPTTTEKLPGESFLSLSTFFLFDISDTTNMVVDFVSLTKAQSYTLPAPPAGGEWHDDRSTMMEVYNRIHSNSGMA